MDNIHQRPPIEEIFKVDISADENNSITISILDLLADPDENNLLGYVNYSQMDTGTLQHQLPILRNSLEVGIKRIEERGYSNDEIMGLILNALMSIHTEN